MKANEIDQVTAADPDIDDPDILDSLPEALSSLLQETNGFVLYHGGLHVRGAAT